MCLGSLSLGDGEFFVQHSGNQNFNYIAGIRLESSFYIRGKSEEILLLPEMEKGRARREGRVKNMISYTDLGFESISKRYGRRKAAVMVLIELLKGKGARKVIVPPDFPSIVAFELKNHFNVDVLEFNPISKMRAVKSKEEVEMIKETSVATVKAFEQALRMLEKGVRRCEDIREGIENYLFTMGYIAQNTIVSSGRGSADPHWIGEGEVENHVVIDIFPKSRRHGYFSDFTRTVLIGDNREIEEMIEAVITAQKRGIEAVREGVRASEVHNVVCDALEELGYHTGRKGHKEGFIHSTGHGVGLEVHEEPSISEDSDEILRAGMVFTIEPGLYYRDIGGVRVEDLVLVRRDGCEVLTEYRRKIVVRGHG